MQPCPWLLWTGELLEAFPGLVVNCPPGLLILCPLGPCGSCGYSYLNWTALLGTFSDVGRGLPVQVAPDHCWLRLGWATCESVSHL